MGLRKRTPGLHPRADDGLGRAAPADRIAAFMADSVAHPEAMVLGEPIFDASAPSIRVKGRKISNWWANLETLWSGIHDSLFGFRVYPVAPLLRLMRSSLWMRRFDFDVEAVVRPELGGGAGPKSTRPGQVFHARRRRGVALPLRAGQRPVELHACPAVRGLPVAAAFSAGPALFAAWGRANGPGRRRRPLAAWRRGVATGHHGCFLRSRCIMPRGPGLLFIRILKDPHRS